MPSIPLSFSQSTETQLQLFLPSHFSLKSHLLFHPHFTLAVQLSLSDFLKANSVSVSLVYGPYTLLHSFFQINVLLSPPPFPSLFPSPLFQSNSNFLHHTHFSPSSPLPFSIFYFTRNLHPCNSPKRRTTCYKSTLHNWVCIVNCV